MISKKGVIDVESLANTYGAMNVLTAGDLTPVASRRGTKPSEAWRQALSEIYTPDSLRGINQFRGLVLFSEPSAWPRRNNKDSYFESNAVWEANSPYEKTAKGLYYNYKVWVPEMDPRTLNFKDKKSLKKRILTLDDCGMSVDLVQQGMQKRISPGTQVTVRYGNKSRVADMEIVNLGPLLFSVDITGVTPDSKFPFGRPPALYSTLGRDGDHLTPLGGSNLGSASRANLKPAKYTPDAIKQCAAVYDSNTAIGGKYRKHNDGKISLLHNEFQPYCKCFIAKAHERNIVIRLNSTQRSNAWQLEHRRWYVEGDSRQTIIAAAAWGPTKTYTTKIVRGKSGLLTGPNKGSYHLVGWAFDFSPVIPMAGGTTKMLRNSDAKSLWLNSGIDKLAADAGVNWGGSFNDQIHNGGRSALQATTNKSMKNALDVFHAANKAGVEPNQLDFTSYMTPSESEGT
jgi:hypothetical protein